MTVITDVGATLTAIRCAKGYTARELAEVLSPVWGVTVSTASGWISKFEAMRDTSFNLFYMHGGMGHQRMDDYLVLLDPLEHHREAIVKGIQEASPSFRLNGSKFKPHVAAPTGADPNVYHRRTRAIEKGWTNDLARIDEVLMEYSL